MKIVIFTIYDLWPIPSNPKMRSKKSTTTITTMMYNSSLINRPFEPDL